MIPKYGCLLLGLLTVCGAAAQHPDDEYYPYAARQEERTPNIPPSICLTSP